MSQSIKVLATGLLWLIINGQVYSSQEEPQDEYQEEHLVDWTPAGVASINHSLIATAGDSLTFRCYTGSFSTIWYTADEQNFNNCNCSVGCILVTNCPYFNDYIDTTQLQRISGTLSDTPDYHPDRCYYFASFSVNTSTLGNLPHHNVGGECETKMLKMRVYVSPKNQAHIPSIEVACNGGWAGDPDNEEMADGSGDRGNDGSGDSTFLPPYSGALSNIWSKGTGMLVMGNTILCG